MSVAMQRALPSSMNVSVKQTPNGHTGAMQHDEHVVLTSPSRLFGGNHWKGPHVPPYRTSGQYALIVGCNRFNDTDGITPLKHCVDDSKSIAAMLEGLGYTVTLLNDDQRGTLAPTFQNVLKALTELCRDEHKYDSVLISFSTHGLLRPSDRKMVLLFQDTIRAHIDEPNCALPLEQVQDILWRCRSKNRIVLVDTCSSGLDTGRGDSDTASIADATREAVAEAERASRRLLAHQTHGVCMLSACTARQKAHEHEGLGVFTRHVIEALLPIRRRPSQTGDAAVTCRAAKPGSSVVTFGDVASYVTERVSAYCRKYNLAPMSPTTFQHSSGDPIIVDFDELMEENTDDGISSVLQSADVHERQYSLPAVDPSVAHANNGGWAWPATKLTSPSAPLSHSLPSPTPSPSSPPTLLPSPSPIPSSTVSMRPSDQFTPVAAVPLTVFPIASIPVATSSTTSPSSVSSSPSSSPPTPSISASSFSFPSALFALPPPSMSSSPTPSPLPPPLEDRPFVSTKLHDSLVVGTPTTCSPHGARDAQQLVDLMTSVGWLQPHDEEQSTRINMEYVVPILREAYATWLAIIAGSRSDANDHPVATSALHAPVSSTPVAAAIAVTSRGLAPSVVTYLSSMGESSSVSSDRVKPSPLTSDLQSLLDALPSTTSTSLMKSLSSSSSTTTSPLPPPSSGVTDHTLFESVGMDMDLFTAGMLAYQQVVEQRLAASTSSSTSSAGASSSWRLDRTTLRMLFMLLTVNGDNHAEIPTRGLPRLTLQGFLFGFLWLGPPWARPQDGCPPADVAINWIFSSYFEDPDEGQVDESKDRRPSQRRAALDVRRCVPEPFYMGPMSRPAAERRIDDMMRHHRGHNVLIRLCEGKCDFRNGHGSEPDITYIFHRKVVESSRQLTTVTATAPPSWSWTHQPQYLWSEDCDQLLPVIDAPRERATDEWRQYQIRGQRVPLKRTIAQRAQARRDRMQKRVKM